MLASVCSAQRCLCQQSILSFGELSSHASAPRDAAELDERRRWLLPRGYAAVRRYWRIRASRVGDDDDGVADDDDDDDEFDDDAHDERSSLLAHYLFRVIEGSGSSRVCIDMLARRDVVALAAAQNGAFDELIKKATTPIRHRLFTNKN